jgi:outer membrane protein OmpA-like peptidoglycan-associated protein
MYAFMVDEYGYAITPSERENTYYSYSIAAPFCVAYPAAGQNSGMVSDLRPDTTYYIRLEGGSETDYTIIISTPQTEETPENAVEEETVFEVPFELNETQVRFVANEAVFIDEEAAKKALSPVAEIILAHPDHPILLAGTTAQWGSQDSCVDLSDRRAGAVKDLLVNSFGVPESQLVTTGLGYADDPFVR